MVRLSRPTIGLLAVAALLSGVSAWQGCAEGEKTAPLTTLAEWVEDRPSDERAKLDAHTIATRNATERLEAITTDVVEGRLSLVEGAERLRDACCAVPTFSWKRFREVNPAATDEERWRHMLIERVKLRLRNDKERAEVIVTRLEAELEEQSR